MKSLLLIFAFVISFNVYGHGDTILEQYLVHHRAVINIKPDSSFSLSPEAGAMVRSCMKGKSLFVLTENTSHEMDMQGYLRPALVEQLIPLNLKYVFLEWGRSIAYCMNAWLDDKYKMSNMNFYDSTERECFKSIIGNKRTFSFVGLDFERGIQFNLAVNNLLFDVDMNTLHKSRAFISKIKNIASLQIPTDNNNKQYYKNVHHFYKEAQKKFYHDSSYIKKELGTKYGELRYLMSNPNNQLPPPWTRPRYISRQRNPQLAKNMLAEITPLDTSAVYFLSIGLEHAQLSHGMMIQIVSRKKVLHNRIVKMNEYCENCTVEGKAGYSLNMGFMKGDVLDAFRNAAGNDLTIFDLSHLPNKYSFIKKHGDLLLFAKNQQ